MSTVIDALIVTLGLDNRDFKKGAKEAEGVTKQTSAAMEKQAKEMEAATKKVMEGFQKITTEALRFFSVLTAGRGVADFTRDVIEGEASLQRFSDNVGVAVSTLSQWGKATELVGGSQGAFNGTVSNITKMFTGLRTGNYTPMFDLLNRLHVAITDVNGQARSVPDLLKGAATQLAQMRGTRADKFNFLTSSGIDEGTANLLLKGPQALQAMVDAQARQAAVTDAQAKSAEKLNEAWIRGRQALEALGMDLVAKVTPAMLKVFGLLEQAGDWLTQHKDVATAFFVGVAIAAAAAAAPLLALVAPFAAIIAGIAATGAALAGLWELWKAWSANSSGITKAVADQWNNAISVIMAAWRLLVAVFTGNSSDIRKAFGDLTGAIGNMFTSTFTLIKTAWHDLVSGITSLVNGSGAVGNWIKGRISALMGTDGAGSAAPAATAPSEPNPTPSEASSIPARLAGVRSVRNFNPGNLNFADQAGAVKESGPGARFARFRNMQDGIAALTRQILLYKNRDHLTTLNSIMGKFAPMSENNTQAYVGTLARGMGVGANDQIDANNPAVMQALIKGISQYEAGGAYLSSAQIGAGMRQAGMAGGSSSTTNTTSIGQITVVTQATDAKGVARDLRHAIVTQNESGLR